MIVTARVRRDGELAQIPAEQLVPGDIVAIEAGDVVPGGRAAADGGDARGRRVGADRGEPAGLARASTPVEAADTPLGDRTDMVYMNTNVTRGAGEFVVTATGMATEVGHISGMLAEHGRREDAAHRPAGEADEADPGRSRASRWSRRWSLNLSRGESFNDGLHRRGRVRDRRDPDRRCPRWSRRSCRGARSSSPKADAIMKRLPLDRDARVDVGDQLGQDRHADAQPDDRGRDDDPGPPLRDRGRGLLDRGHDQARRRAGRRAAGAVPAADGAGVRRRGQGRRADRRPDRGRAGRAGREGRRSTSSRRGSTTRGSPSCRSTRPTS